MDKKNTETIPDLGDPAERYRALADAFLGDPDVAQPGQDTGSKSAFGSDALKTHGKIFAMLTRGRLVVKLPKNRVDALIAAGDGARFDPGHGRLMKEWLSLDPNSDEDWAALAREAKDFVASRG